MVSSVKDYEARKALACQKMKKIWKSNINKAFLSAVESAVLLHGSKTCTVDVKMKKKIDGCYTKHKLARNNLIQRTVR